MVMRQEHAGRTMQVIDDQGRESRESDSVAPDVNSGRSDPTRVRNQPALTTSTGLAWLIVGGLLAATGIAILVPMLELGLPAVAMTGIVLLVGLYAAMLLTRLLTRPGRIRLGVMAIAMLAIAAVALICIGAITAAEWNLLS